MLKTVQVRFDKNNAERAAKLDELSSLLESLPKHAAALREAQEFFTTLRSLSGQLDTPAKEALGVIGGCAQSVANNVVTSLVNITGANTMSLGVLERAYESMQ